MLKTLTNSLKERRQEDTFAGYVLEATDSATTRDVFMDDMGDDPEENLSDEEMMDLIENIPESDIEDEASLTEGTVKVKDVVDGEEKDIDIEEVIENFVPETDY